MMDQLQFDQYLKHLHTERWPIVRVTTGKGIEISDNPFLVLPLAVKIVTDGYVPPIKEMNYLVSGDFFKLDEVDAGSLSYIFVTEPQDKYIPKGSIKNWSTKLVDGGFLILHGLVDGHYKFDVMQYTSGGFSGWSYPEKAEK